MFGYLSLDERVGPPSRERPKPLNTISLPHGKIFSEKKSVTVGRSEILLSGKITKVFSGQVSLNDFNGMQESLIHSLYVQHGDSFVELLDGLFFILIYDYEKNRLGLYNNRYQASNLYYYRDDSWFAFSKRLTDLLDLLPERPRVHKGSVLNFISNGFTSSDQTQIDGVKKLLPTARIIVENKKTHLSNHWSKEFSFQRRPFADLERHLDEYERTYQEGLKNHFSQNPPDELGCLLSGGHDTSFAFVQASKLHEKPLHAFTVTFPGWAFDEGRFAENIAHKCGGIFHPIPFQPEHIDYVPEVIRSVEEPIVGTCLPTHLCAITASKYVKSMLAGDGGDTLWAEYHPVAEFHKYIRHMPLLGRKSIHGLSKFLAKTTDWERFWELEHVASLFTEKDYYRDFMRRLCTYRHFRDESQRDLFTGDFLHSTSISKNSIELEFNEGNFQEMLIEAKLIHGFYCYQSFHTTKSFESYDIDFYLPTINRDLMTFITSLPQEWVNGGSSFDRLTNSKKTNRLFHKKALQRYLPKEEIYNRSFDIPWHRILRPRARLLRALLLRLKARGWYREEALDRLFTEFFRQEAKDHELLELKHHGYRIFTLLSLEVWCMEYIDGKLAHRASGPIPLEDYFSA